MKYRKEENTETCSFRLTLAHEHRGDGGVVLLYFRDVISRGNIVYAHALVHVCRNHHLRKDNECEQMCKDNECEQMRKHNECEQMHKHNECEQMHIHTEYASARMYTHAPYSHGPNPNH